MRTLKELIDSIEKKLQMDLTEASRRREEDIKEWLIKLNAETEVQQMTISDLRLQNQELMDYIRRTNR